MVEYFKRPIQTAVLINRIKHAALFKRDCGRKIKFGHTRQQKNIDKAIYINQLRSILNL